MRTAYTTRERIQSAFGGDGLLLTGITDRGQQIGIYVNERQLTEITDKVPTAGCIGHALWHVQNPDSPFPCESCRVHVYSQENKTRRPQSA